MIRHTHVAALTLVVLMFQGPTGTVNAAEWNGPNLLINGDFSSGFTSWSKSSNSWNLVSGSLVRINTLRDEWLRQSVQVEAGKRYRVSGFSRAFWDSSVGAGRGRTRISASGITATDWWNPAKTTLSTPKTGLGIATSATTTVELTWDIITTSQIQTLFGEFHSIGLRQVVFDPSLDILQPTVRMNTASPGGDSGSVPLDLLSVSFADEPTAWSIDWGDSVVDAMPTLGTATSHGYQILSGDSETWTATLAGSNQAGAGQDTAEITLLRQPDAHLRINGQVIADGAVVEILPGALAELSLTDSIGFIEIASFDIPGVLNQIGSSLSFTDTLLGGALPGDTFNLSTSVGNTGLGVNSDAVNVTLLVVPEPMSATLLAGLILVFQTRRRFQ